MEFAVGGYSVIPIGKDKRPLLKSWKEFQTKAADDAQIEKWWEMWPEANIGIVTGKVSGITVVDVDTYKGGERKKFPPTFTVKTGNGGFHLYYQYQEGLTVSANAYPQHPGVDIRSDGGYVVAPYSTTSYLDKGVQRGGSYEVEKNIIPRPFPIALFASKKKRTLSDTVGVSEGGRNDSIASFIGRLLVSSNERDWEKECWPATVRANKTYQPPLTERELRTTFDSILKKEKTRRADLIKSPIQLDDGEVMEISIRKGQNGSPFKDMANVHAVLSQHPYYKDSFKYNTFRSEIEYNGRAIDDADLVKIQYFLQTAIGLSSVSKDAVYDAVSHYAHQNAYDEALEWLKLLKWDKKPRLFNWLSDATGVDEDDYHRGIGTQWFMGMIRRICEPGALFDYVLVFVGKQGIGKTSLFRIIGGQWYKSYTGQIDNKDFYLALRGALILDLDEGAAMYKSEAIKIKAIITDTHDEYRAPYDRVMKKYPRRFVFSMSTNDTEPFRDVTGNRRYWVVNGREKVNFEWLIQNRDQLFAEAYHYYLKKKDLPQVPFDIASEIQEQHLPEDSWTELVVNTVRKSPAYCRGDDDYATSVLEVFKTTFAEEPLSRFSRPQEMRIANIFRKTLGLERVRKMLDGERKWCWVICDEMKAKLQAKPISDTRDDFDMHGVKDEDLPV